MPQYPSALGALKQRPYRSRPVPEPQDLWDVDALLADTKDFLGEMPDGTGSQENQDRLNTILADMDAGEETRAQMMRERVPKVGAFGAVADSAGKALRTVSSFGGPLAAGAGEAIAGGLESLAYLDGKPLPAGGSFLKDVTKTVGKVGTGAAFGRLNTINGSLGALGARPFKSLAGKLAGGAVGGTTEGVTTNVIQGGLTRAFDEGDVGAAFDADAAKMDAGLGALVGMPMGAGLGAMDALAARSAAKIRPRGLTGPAPTPQGPASSWPRQPEAAPWQGADEEAWQRNQVNSNVRGPAPRARRPPNVGNLTGHGNTPPTGPEFPLDTQLNTPNPQGPVQAPSIAAATPDTSWNVVNDVRAQDPTQPSAVGDILASLDQQPPPTPEELAAIAGPELPQGRFPAGSPTAAAAEPFVPPVRTFPALDEAKRIAMLETPPSAEELQMFAMREMANPSADVSMTPPPAVRQPFEMTPKRGQGGKVNIGSVVRARSTGDQVFVTFKDMPGVEVPMSRAEFDSNFPDLAKQAPADLPGDGPGSLTVTPRPGRAPRGAPENAAAAGPSEADLVALRNERTNAAIEDEFDPLQEGDLARMLGVDETPAPAAAAAEMDEDAIAALLRQADEADNPPVAPRADVDLAPGERRLRHSSFQPFDRFTRDAAASDGNNRLGHWFTDSDTAHFGPIDYDAAVRMENPYPVGTRARLAEEIEAAGGPDAFVAKMRAAGHDGLSLSEAGPDGSPMNSFVAFDDTQARVLGRTMRDQEGFNRGATPEQRAAWEGQPQEGATPSATPEAAGPEMTLGEGDQAGTINQAGKFVPLEGDSWRTHEPVKNKSVVIRKADGSVVTVKDNGGKVPKRWIPEKWTAKQEAAAKRAEAKAAKEAEEVAAKKAAPVEPAAAAPEATSSRFTEDGDYVPPQTLDSLADDAGPQPAAAPEAPAAPKVKFTGRYDENGQRGVKVAFDGPPEESVRKALSEYGFRYIGNKNDPDAKSWKFSLEDRPGVTAEEVEAARDAILRGEEVPSAAARAAATPTGEFPPPGKTSLEDRGLTPALREQLKAKGWTRAPINGRRTWTPAAEAPAAAPAATSGPEAPRANPPQAEAPSVPSARAASDSTATASSDTTSGTSAKVDSEATTTSSSRTTPRETPTARVNENSASAAPSPTQAPEPTSSPEDDVFGTPRETPLAQERRRLLDEMNAIYDRRPRPIKKTYGNNPTEAQQAEYAERVKAYNREYSKARRAFKAADEKASAEYTAAREAKREPGSIYDTKAVEDGAKDPAIEDAADDLLAGVKRLLKDERGSLNLKDMGEGLAGLEKLAKANPRLLMTALRTAGGGFIGGLTHDDEDATMLDNVLIGAAVGYGGLRFTGKAWRTLRAKAPTVYKHVRMAVTGVNPDFDPKAAPRARPVPDMAKDITGFQKWFWSPDKVVPDVWRHVRPIMQSMYELDAPAKKLTETQIQVARQTQITEALAYMKEMMRKATDEGQPKRAAYIKALTEDLVSSPTVPERFLSDLTNGKLTPQQTRKALAAVSNGIYHSLLGWNIGSGLANATQVAFNYPVLGAKATVKGILKAYSKEGRAELAFLNLNRKPLGMEREKHFNKWMEGYLNASQIPMRWSDSANRRATYAGALEYAAERGMNKAQATDFANELIGVTQGIAGDLGSNPFHRQLGPLRVFTKYPLIWGSMIQDFATHPDPAVKRRFFGMMTGIFAATALSGIQLTNFFIPRMGMVPGASTTMDVGQHLFGEPDHDFEEHFELFGTEDAIGPKYAGKLVAAGDRFNTNGLDDRNIIGRKGQVLRSVSAAEDFGSLLGIETSNRAAAREEESGMYELASKTKREESIRSRRIRREAGVALERGDKAGANRALKALSDRQRKEFKKERLRTARERARRLVPLRRREEFDDQFPEDQ